MYPLNICLVGCADNVLPDLRRELTNLGANIEGEWPDVRSALAELSSPRTNPRLLIVQPKSFDEASDVERLNEILIGQPILALVDPASDSSMFLRAMRSGAAQVVRVPLQSEDFQGAMRRIAVQFGSPLTKSRVIAVCGVTEGCGATTIAVNLTAEIAYLQKVSCVLVEASVQLGRLAVYLNVKPQVTIYDLLKDLDRVDLGTVRQALTKIADNFHVLVGSYAGVTPLTISLQDILRLHGYVRQLADVIVVDMPYKFDDTYFDFLAGVHEVVIVAEQKVTSIYALKMVLGELEKRQLLATPTVVINRYSTGIEGLSGRHIEEILGLSNLMTIANDHAAIITAENQGHLLRVQSPHSPALADIDALAREVMGLEPPPSRWTLRTVCSELAGRLGLR